MSTVAVPERMALAQRLHRSKIDAVGAAVLILASDFTFGHIMVSFSSSIRAQSTARTVPQRAVTGIMRIAAVGICWMTSPRRKGYDQRSSNRRNALTDLRITLMATVYQSSLGHSDRHVAGIGLLIVLAQIPLTEAYAQDELASGLEECAALSADAERLACYDRLQRGAPQADDEPSEASPANAIIEADVTETTSTETTSSETTSTETTASEITASEITASETTEIETTASETAAERNDAGAQVEPTPEPQAIESIANRNDSGEQVVQSAEPAEESSRRPFWRRLRDRIARRGEDTDESIDEQAASGVSATRPDEAQTNEPRPDDGIEVTVVDVRRNLSGLAVFLTEDNDTWVQISTRDRTYPETPFTARITGGLMGGRFLTPESGGIAVRVRGPD